MLTSNPYIKRLELRDSGLCGAGAEALAGALSKSSICGRCCAWDSGAGYPHTGTCHPPDLLVLLGAGPHHRVGRVGWS